MLVRAALVDIDDVPIGTATISGARALKVDIVGGTVTASDALSTALITGAISVTNVASEAKVGVTAQANRKLLTIMPTGGTIYWGYSAGVTTSTGTPIFKNQMVSFPFANTIPVFVIAGSTIDARVAEAS